MYSLGFFGVCFVVSRCIPCCFLVHTRTGVCLEVLTLEKNKGMSGNKWEVSQEESFGMSRGEFWYVWGRTGICLE